MGEHLLGLGFDHVQPGDANPNRDRDQGGAARAISVTDWLSVAEEEPVDIVPRRFDARRYGLISSIVFRRRHGTREYGVGWTILPRTHPLNVLFSLRKDWNLAYADDVTAIYARTPE